MKSWMPKAASSCEIAVETEAVEMFSRSEAESTEPSSPAATKYSICLRLKRITIAEPAVPHRLMAAEAQSMPAMGRSRRGAGLLPLPASGERICPANRSLRYHGRRVDLD